jgi:predicted transcriptional regulator
MSVCAINARIAGETVFTATSQGVSNFSPDMLLWWENLFKDAVCHLLYDVRPGGSYLQTLRFRLLSRQNAPNKESENMKTQETFEEEAVGITNILRSLDQECKNCAPTSPLECISNCNVWKIRNEFRKLCETMENPNYMKDLLNVLKNQTRLAILQTIEKNRHSVTKLQAELKKAGYLHSQETISEEYLGPLLKVGLAVESQDQFCATTFGSKLVGLVKNIPEFTNILPAHSECYEENILKSLFSGPKTFEEIKDLVPSKIVSRILKRLKTVRLMETPEERDYIFFFRSKRDSSKETLTTTEAKVYENIPDEGVSAKKLAGKTDLSLRRTYKYVRGLKGKKLVFARKTPKTYALTDKGERLAWLLSELHKLVEETVSFSEEFARYKENS